MATVELIHGAMKATTLRKVLEDAREIVIVSAFTTPRGIDEVSKPILECVKRGGDVTLLLGIDRTIASPELVRRLGVLLRKGAGRLKVVFVVEAGRTFLHAKIFAAKKARVAEVLVGSFNLTGRGLTSNHEFAARLVGNASSFFDDLHSFIDEVPDKRVLTLSNVEELAHALTRVRNEPDPEAAEARRKAASARLEQILKALPQAAAGIIRDDEIARSLSALLQAGAFYNYQIDLEKLSVPSGLNRVYEAGLLAKEKAGSAGTFTLKRSNVLSASAPLVPPQHRSQFRRLATSLGKTMSSYGFATPMGHWIPNVFRHQLEAKVVRLSKAVPAGQEFESEVRRFVEEHLAKLDLTTSAILAEATSSGVEPPSRWRKVRDPALAAIRQAALESGAPSWRGSEGETQAIDWIRGQLQSVREKLDADLAIGKLRRIRPEIVRLPVDPIDLSPDDARRVLECMAWSVAEDRGQKRTRHAVRSLAERLVGNPKSNFDSLQGLSEALLEGADGAEHGFFSLFGRPPYWSVPADEVHDLGDDAEDDEVTDEDDD